MNKVIFVVVVAVTMLASAVLMYNGTNKQEVENVDIASFTLYNHNWTQENVSIDVNLKTDLAINCSRVYFFRDDKQINSVIVNCNKRRFTLNFDTFYQGDNLITVYYGDYGR